MDPEEQPLFFLMISNGLKHLLDILGLRILIVMALTMTLHKLACYVWLLGFGNAYCLLNLGLNSFVEFLNLRHSFGGFSVHLVPLLERYEVKGTKWIFSIDKLEWGLIYSPT